ncbi:MAG: MFS transporter [Candidatus Rokubacteria bacterium]|nr:MFS transporter [Candidatus Rokubacteria bacterium]
MTRWIAGAGAFVMSLDSMVNVAFPAMAGAFDRPPEAMRWIIIPYVFSYSLVSFFGGAVADRIGHARVFRAGLAGSAVAFGLAAAAPAFEWLVAARILQGLAGGLVYGTAPGIITLAAPPAERGRALGFLNACIGFAFALGPVVAGALVGAFGWPAVFAVRVPAALAVLAWAALALPAARAVAGARTVRPADILRGRVVVPAALAFLANAGIFAIWLLAPFYLVGVRGLGALAAGTMFMMTPLGTTVAAPVAGRIVDRVGARWPVAVGLALETVGLAVLSGAREETPIAVVAVALFSAGFGLGLFQVPNMTLVMAQFPAGQQGAAGGLSFMARTLGVVAGVGALSAIFAARRPVAGFDSAFATAFVVAAGIVAVACVASVVRSRAADGRGRL